MKSRCDEIRLRQIKSKLRFDEMKSTHRRNDFIRATRGFHPQSGFIPHEVWISLHLPSANAVFDKPFYRYRGKVFYRH